MTLDEICVYYTSIRLKSVTNKPVGKTANSQTLRSENPPSFFIQIQHV